jgi:hypothetical protein
MLKISCVPVSLSVCIASLSLASGAIVTAPYLIANSRTPAKTKSNQCRTLFATVVNSQNMGSGFYSRKASNIRSLELADGKLRSLQSRFSSVFNAMESAQQNADRQASRRLGQQASQLVNELNQQCLR